MRQQFFTQRHQLLRFFVARFGALAFADNGFFHTGQIGQRQLGADGFDVGNRVDFAGHMHDIVVIKAAHHVYNRIGFADVGEKLVAQALALARACHQAGNVDKFHNRRLHFLRVYNFRQRRHARVGHFHNAHIGLDGAERIIGRLDARLGQGVEKGGFSDVGQADDAAF